MAKQPEHTHTMKRMSFLWLVLIFATFPAKATTLLQAQILLSDKTHQVISLPDSWPLNHQNYAGAIWYRLDIDIQKPEALLGIYLKRACNNAWIYANGKLLYSGGGPLNGQRVLRRCHEPVLAAWPADAQKAGHNEILIRLHSDASNTISSAQRQGYLSAVQIAPWQQLKPIYDREYQIRISTPQVISGLMALIATVLLMIWWRVRRDTTYLYFALCMASGAIGVARVYVFSPGLDNLTMERLIPCMVVLICLGLMGCLKELYSLHVRFYRAWWTLAVLTLLALILCPPGLLNKTALAAYGVSALLAGQPLAQLLVRMVKKPFREQKMFMVSTSILMLAGIHDLLVQHGLITFNDRPLIQNVIPILLLGFIFRLMANHAQALTTAETAREDLELRVQLITKEIEASYAHAMTLEKTQAAQSERERIARDLHDDLGARLLTLVHRTSDAVTSAYARDALSDLRLLISDLHAPSGLLSEALSDWRAEACQRCEASGTELDWQSNQVPTITLGTRQKITLARLLREAISNTLKHTRSTKVTVQVTLDDTMLCIRVIDQGDGEPVAHWKSGVGLQNLRMRAAQIGASLSWRDIVDANGKKCGSELQAQIPVSSLESQEA